MEARHFAKVFRTDELVDWDYLARELDGLAELARSSRSPISREDILGIVALRLGFAVEFDEAELRRIEKQKRGANVIDLYDWVRRNVVRRMGS